MSSNRVRTNGRQLSANGRKLVITDATHIGRVRQRNEDCHTCTRRFFAVADGIGGSPCGDVASRTAIDAALASLGNERSPEAIVKKAFEAAQKKMRTLHVGPCRGMGATLTALAFDDTLHEVVIGHSGDSRAYVFRNRALTQLTDDEVITSPRGRTLLMGAITTSEQTPMRIYKFNPEIGDMFVLCTDGVTGELSDDRIAQILCATNARDTGAKKLVSDAVDAGGRDNATAITIRVSERRS